MNMKNSRFTKVYPWLPGVVCEVAAAILAAVYSALYDADATVFVELLGAALLPFVIPVVSLFLKKPLPTVFAWALAVFVIMAVGLGTVMGLYEKISWWDLLLHGLSGLLCAIAVFMLIIRWGGAKLSPAGCMVIIAVFALGISGLWEIIEYTFDAITGGDAQKVAESLAAGKAGTADSMEDMLISMVGVAVFYIMLAVDKKFGYKLFGSLADFHGFDRSVVPTETCAEEEVQDGVSLPASDKNVPQYGENNAAADGEESPVSDVEDGG